MNTVKIPYQNSSYTYKELANMFNCSDQQIKYYYHKKNCKTGEEISEALKIYGRLKAIQIPYNGKLYSTVELAKIFNTTTATIYHHYVKGLTTGEEIEKTIKRIADTQIKIPYAGKTYNASELSKEIKISANVVLKYYHRGHKTGEEILQAAYAFEDNKLRIPYKGEMYKPVELAKLLGVERTNIYNYYNRGYNTGEEIEQAIARTLPTIISSRQIPYKGQVYSINQLATILGCSTATVSTRYKEGYKTGEEIEESLKNNIRLIPYKGQQYTVPGLAEVLELSTTTINKYYNKGYKTGEAILQARIALKAARKYTSNNTNCAKVLISYNGQKYKASEIAKILKVSESTVYKYYYNGCTSGEQILAAMSKANNSSNNYQKIKLTFNNKEISVPEFVKLTGISRNIIYSYYYKGITSGEQILKAVNDAKANSQKIRLTFNNKEISVPEFVKLTGISRNIIYSYYYKGITRGEDILNLIKVR